MENQKMKQTVRYFKGSTEVDNAEQCDYAQVSTSGTKEELEKLFPELFGKRVYIDNVLGCIAIDPSGHRVYEDIVHDLGGGKYMYYIQGIGEWSQEHNRILYTVPEREDLPKESWGKKVWDRWIQFHK